MEEMKIIGDTSRDIYDIEYKIEIPSDKVTSFISRPLVDLNLFIGFLKSKKPECIDDLTQDLIKRLKSLTLDSESTFDFEYESQHLSKYPELEEITKQVTLGMLNYTKYENDLQGESLKILSEDYIKSYVPTNNRTITALVEVIGRDAALTLYKEYVDYRTDIMKKPTTSKYESLEQFYKLMISEGGSGPQGGVGAILEGGMVVFRVDRCMWHELQKEYGDMEIAYVTACHYDFYAATLWNENFELTRTKTCMQGGYCDFCWHDKRYDKEMKHPPDEFWKNLE